MDQGTSFSYTYSARENQEVLRIRKKYLPQSESKLEELQRLDRTVQNSGVVESLCAGVGGCLIFGLGLCLAMEVIGHMVWLGVLLGLAGAAGMLAAFPLYRKFFNRAKAQYSPRILELAAELSGQIS
jgi:hypothetical protein